MPIFQHRRARRLSYLNGGLWATGNGLASSGMLIYMAIDWARRGWAWGWR